MADQNRREALRELYREGLGECGFIAADVERGLQMLESDRYVGFGDVVSSLRIFSGASVGVREDELQRIVQHTQTLEGRLAVATHAVDSGAAGRVAARRAQEAEDREDALRRAHVRVQELEALLREMTPGELDGRTPLRPHIAEGLREHAGYEGEVRAGPRPSWVGRAPGPKTIREVVEPPAGVVESFRSLGLSEEAAERAAKGR